MFKELYTHISLVRVRQALSSGQFLKGRNLATALVSKAGDDVRGLILLADACLFCGEPLAAKRWYNYAIEKKSENPRWSANDRKFVGAYISNRLLECSFLVNNESKVPRACVVEQINEMPASQGLKALLFVNSEQTNVPRRYDSRNGRKRERSLR